MSSEKRWMALIGLGEAGAALERKSFFPWDFLKQVVEHPAYPEVLFNNCRMDSHPLRSDPEEVATVSIGATRGITHRRLRCSPQGA